MFVRWLLRSFVGLFVHSSFFFFLFSSLLSFLPFFLSSFLPFSLSSFLPFFLLLFFYPAPFFLRLIACWFVRVFLIVRFRRFVVRFSCHGFNACLLCCLFGIIPPAPRTLLPWPGGLREAIKSAVPEGASGVLNNFIKSFAKSFANPAGLFGLFLSKKLF